MNMELPKVNKQTMVQQAVRKLHKYILESEGEITRLPSEAEIAKKMGISRLTIREALTVLESEGLISKNQGSSTVVTTFARKLAENIDYVGELGSFIQNCGYQLDVRIISYDWVMSDSEVMENLELKVPEEILLVKKSFLADGNPAAFCINRIPRKYISNIRFEEEDFGKSMFDFVENKTDMEFSHDYIELIPRLVTEEVSEVLKVEINSPILRAEVKKYSMDGDLLMYNSEYYVDSLIRFSALRSNYGTKISKIGKTISRRKDE